jgi:hypothetical protein
VQGILSDAAGAIEQLLPLPEIEEMRTLIEATINGTLDILQVGNGVCLLFVILFVTLLLFGMYSLAFVGF